MIELALVMPLVVGLFGLGFFAAHVYEVRSDLQRTAQRTAAYAADRCDPLASYHAASDGTASGCALPAQPTLCGTTTNGPANGCYRTDRELADFATAKFFTGSRTGKFAIVVTPTTTGSVTPTATAYDGRTLSTCNADPDKLCKSFDPDVAGPRPNQRISITLRYRFNTPFATLMSALGFDSLAVNLVGHGEATVE